MLQLPLNKKIILFDGDCNLCKKSIQYIIKQDRKDIFRFVSLQSNLGQEIVCHIGINALKIDSIILYEPGIAYYYKSEAVIQIAANLGGIFKLGTILRIFPPVISDKIYDFIAKKRYSWFGKQASCLMPTTAVKRKFLS